MTNKDFETKILDFRLSEIIRLLGIKGKEYGSDLDRFSNFKDIAKVSDDAPEHVAFTLMMKHFSFIKDICQHKFRKDMITTKLINEKIGDCINYLILIEGIIKEKYNDILVDNEAAKILTDERIKKTLNEKHHPYKFFKSIST